MAKVEIVFWDVQHGHATYIKSPNGRHIVIDLGIGKHKGTNHEFSPLRHLRYNYNITRVDYLIITHPHLDHIDDILNFDLVNPKVFHRPKQLTNEEVMEGVRENDRAKFEKYCKENDNYNVSVAGGTDDPDNPDNFGAMKLLTFNPWSCSHDNFNNQSIVTVVEYEGIKVVIPGDNESCSYEKLMARDSFKDAVRNSDILLAPHHGRESGFNNDFINLVNPRLTVVSDGRFCDTSANGRYSQKSRGWTVHKSNGTSSERKCLTTNSDGVVYVEFGASSDPNYNNYLSVRID